MTRPGVLLACLALLPLGSAHAALAQAQEKQTEKGQAAYEAGQFGAARSIWEVEAAAGDADAAFGLGLLYDLGQDVHQNAGAAYGWYLRAAAAGHAQAEFNVAVMNDSGRGTAPNPANAAAWYARAAAHGLGRAQYDLAQLYEAGEGVPQNPEAALAWYQAASSALPAAASRAAQLRARLEAHPATAGLPGGALAAPSAVEPAKAGSGRAGELVWSAPLQPFPVHYYVVVLSLDVTPPAPVFTGFTDRTALLVEAVPSLHAYAWRVCAVGRAAPHYTAGAWMTVGR